MNSAYASLSDFVDRALDRVTQNLTFGKVLVQLGLDPNHLTLDAIGARLLEVALANITVANMCALVGAGFYAATLLMRTPGTTRLSASSSMGGVG